MAEGSLQVIYQPRPPEHIVKWGRRGCLIKINTIPQATLNPEPFFALTIFKSGSFLGKLRLLCQWYCCPEVHKVYTVSLWILCFSNNISYYVGHVLPTHPPGLSCNDDAP